MIAFDFSRFSPFIMTIHSVRDYQKLFRLGLMGHTCNPSSQEVEAGEFWELETSLDYFVSSKTALATDCYYLKQNAPDKQYLRTFK